MQAAAAATFAAVSIASLAGTPASAGVPLAPHRAIYDLSLISAKEGGGVQTVSGRMVFEFRRESCKGFALKFRQVMTLGSGEGQDGLYDFQSESYEADDGSEFRFSSKSKLNADKDTNVDGAAVRGSDKAIALDLKQPKPTRASFTPDIVFPTEHLKLVLDAAEHGSAILSKTVFDGAEPGDKPSNTLAVIGGPLNGADGLPADEPKPGDVAGLRRWPVTISYFDGENKDGGEETPKFVYGFELFENGVSRALRLDYGTFVLSGRLTKVDMLPADGDCNK